MTGRRLGDRLRSLLESERGTVFKDRGGRVSVCLVYPNTYSIGMSSLGFQGIYGLLNARADVVCERAFLPDAGDMEEYRRTNSALCSLETQSPLSGFDIVAFSISFENDYPNIPLLLEMGRIPPESAERNSSHPLVIAGGVCPSANPEPIAPFFDICFIGEAEEMLDEFIGAYKSCCSRDDLLRLTIGIPGLYVPSFYEVRYGPDGAITGRIGLAGAPERITRRRVRDLSLNPMRSAIITPETEFGNMCLIEPMRGCPWACRFCLAGHLYSPSRRKDTQALIAEISDARTLTSRIGLVGPSLSDHPDMAQVMGMEGVEFSITSLRANPKSAALSNLLRTSRSVSIAPETGSDRLREYVNKKVSREDIIETARLILLDGRIERLRLYFMLGLPTETDEDADAIVGLVSEIRAVAPRGQLVLTLSVFVPKAGTPFERMPMAPPDVVKRRISIVKKGLVRVPRSRVSHDVLKYAYMQGLFSMGDRRVAGVLTAMRDEPDWRRAARSVGIEPEFYMMREKPVDESLPWGFIRAQGV